MTPTVPLKSFGNISSLRKDHVGVSTLSSGGKQVTDSFDKAKLLNNQFHSVFTNENLTDIPTAESSYPSMPEISFSTEGIFKLLCELDTNKSSGPDEIPSMVCVLQKSHQYSKSSLPNLCQPELFLVIGLLQMLHQFLRRTIEAILLITDPSPSLQLFVKLWSMLFTTQ